MSEIQYNGSSLSYTYGWLSPEGSFFGCNSLEHDSVAVAIVKDLYPNEYKLYNCSRTLEKHGYLRIVKSTCPNRKIEVLAGNNFLHLTAYQKKYLNDINYPLDEVEVT